MKAISILIASVFLVTLATPPALAVTRGPAPQFTNATKRTGIDTRQERMRRQQVRDRAKSIGQIRTTRLLKENLKQRSTPRIRAEIVGRHIVATVREMRLVPGHHVRFPILHSASIGGAVGLVSWLFASASNSIGAGDFKYFVAAGASLATLLVSGVDSFMATRYSAAPQHHEELIRRGNPPASSLKAKANAYLMDADQPVNVHIIGRR